MKWSGAKVMSTQGLFVIHAMCLVLNGSLPVFAAATNDDSSNSSTDDAEQSTDLIMGLCGALFLSGLLMFEMLRHFSCLKEVFEEKGFIDGQENPKKSRYPFGWVLLPGIILDEPINVSKNVEAGTPRGKFVKDPNKKQVTFDEAAQENVSGENDEDEADEEYTNRGTVRVTSLRDSQVRVTSIRDSQGANVDTFSVIVVDKSVENIILERKDQLSLDVPAAIEDESPKIKVLGLDCMTLLRFASFCRNVSLSAAFVGMIILAPLYGSYNDGDDVSSIIARTSVTSIQGKTREVCMWMVCIFAIIFTFPTLYFIKMEYEWFVRARQKYFTDETSANPYTHHTIMVECIPHHWRDPRLLVMLFHKLHPSEVMNIKVHEGHEINLLSKTAREMNKLEENSSKDNEIPNLRDLRNSHSIHLENMSKRFVDLQKALDSPRILYEDKRLCEQFYNAWNFEKADHGFTAIGLNSVGHWLHTNLLQPFQLLTVGGDAKTLTGFVTLSSQRAKVMCCNSVIFKNPKFMRKTIAPDPEDIVWTNIAIDIDQINIRKSFINVVVVIALLFWSVIVAETSDITKDLYDLYVKKGDDDDFILEYKKDLFNEWLPVLFILCLLQLVPPLFKFIGLRYIKFRTYNRIERFAMVNYMFFQLTNIFINLFKDGVLGILQQTISISDFISALQEPETAVYLATFIMSSFGTSPIYLIRAMPVFKTTVGFKNWFKSKKLTSPKKPVYPNCIEYCKIYPVLSAVLCMVFLQWVISPVLSLCAAIYFTAMRFILGYMIRAWWQPQYESGGKYFFIIYKVTTQSLLVSHLMLFMFFFNENKYILMGIQAFVVFMVYQYQFSFKQKYELQMQNVVLVDGIKKDDEIYQNRKAMMSVRNIDDWRKVIMRRFRSNESSTNRESEGYGETTRGSISPRGSMMYCHPLERKSLAAAQSLRILNSLPEKCEEQLSMEMIRTSISSLTNPMNSRVDESILSL